ncbi:hypothetical protein D9619_012057 [Psilocybe cf. subviscida]|uniref:DUF6534 domain-containing protein n=1 Tax=Psilocybe cf. subviscida TaxID=2480587 RepID=A0A8H5B8P6_9AGAR|nr:hypothetical protein D9619_012057 [Psilocybe cf. subviscida]
MPSFCKSGVGKIPSLSMGNITIVVPDDVVMVTGPRIVGYILHFILFGVLSLQVYIYSSAFPNDVLINKVFVYAAYLLEVTQSIMMSYTAFQVFAIGYGHGSGYDQVGITWFSIPLISGLVGFLAQAFYAYRLSILSRSWVVASVVLALATIHLGGAIATAMIFKEAGLFSKLFGRNYLITAGIWNGGGALCDLIICISMAYYLAPELHLLCIATEKYDLAVFYPKLAPYFCLVMATNGNGTVVEIPDDFVLMIGPRLIGHILHFTLFGVLSLQVYIYAIGLPKDSLFNKICVTYVYLLATAQTGMMAQMAYRVFATGYGQPSYYNSIGPTWFSIPLVSGLVTFAVQLFYARRLLLLSRSKVVAGLIVALSTVQLAGAIATAVVFKQAGYFSTLFDTKFHLVLTAGIWNGGGALCDVLIVGATTHYLLSLHSGQFKSTQLVVNKLIRLAIETGMLTAIVAIMNFIFCLLPSRPSFSEATSEILAAVYANSMMLVLNTRIRAVPTDVEEPHVPAPKWINRHSILAQGNGAIVNKHPTMRNLDGIKITTEEIVFTSVGEIRSVANKDDHDTDSEISEISSRLSDPQRPSSYMRA